MKSQGITFFGVLALIFIGLKLAGVGIVAGWSWWIVLSPLWIPVTLAASICLVYFVGMAVRKAWRR